MSDFTTMSIMGIPIFTYGMIGLTTVVLAFATVADYGSGISPIRFNFFRKKTFFNGGKCEKQNVTRKRRSEKRVGGKTEKNR